MQIICAPYDFEVSTTDKGVVIVKIREMSELEIYLGGDDTSIVQKIQSAVFDAKAMDLGIE